MLFRMVPPGHLDYFFTVGYSNQIDKGAKKEVKHMIDTAKPSEVPPEPIEIKSDEFKVEVPRLNYVEGDIG